MSIIDTRKNEILKRSKSRNMKVEIGNIKNHHSFTCSLSISESISLVSRLSKESYFLETGIVPTDKVDKSIVKVLVRD